MTRQLAFPFPDATKPTKKRLGQLSPQQERALERLASSSSEYVIGIDEVGLGCWAGPVTVAAVVFRKDFDHDKIVDSKRISHKKRMAVLQQHILPNAQLFCVLSQPNTAVDAEGLREVQGRLTEGCALFCRHRFPRTFVVQDGDIPFEIDGGVTRVVWMPKADAIVPAVSAASILAKVTRDLYMKQQAELYPGYGWKTNVGYRSNKHIWGLENLGVTPLHRRSFKPVAAYARAKPTSSW